MIGPHDISIMIYQPYFLLSENKYQELSIDVILKYINQEGISNIPILYDKSTSEKIFSTFKLSVKKLLI